MQGPVLEDRKYFFLPTQKLLLTFSGTVVDKNMIGERAREAGHWDIAWWGRKLGISNTLLWSGDVAQRYNTCLAWVRSWGVVLDLVLGLVLVLALGLGVREQVNRHSRIKSKREK